MSQENPKKTEASKRYSEHEEVMSDEDFKKSLAEEEKRDAFIDALREEMKKTGDPKKEVLLYVEYAKDQMKRRFGVDNLTNIEAVHLRKIVEETLVRYKNDWEMAKQGEISGMDIPEVELEAAALWLERLYGIPFKDIPQINTVVDKTAKEDFVFQQTQLKDAMNKEKQLKAQGHDVSITIKTHPDFNEYIRRLREKSHQP